MNKKKIMMSVLSASLVGVVAVGGTLAYLSDKSNTVTNTFNVGTGYTTDENKHTGLWLDEVLWENNQASATSRTESANTYADLMPGSIVTKDPTFHLTAGSTDSYVFAEIKGLDALVAAGFVVSDTDLEGLEEEPESNLSYSWQKVKDNGNDKDAGLDGLYIYGIQADSWAEDPIQPMTPSGGQDGVTLDALFNYVKYSTAVENTQHKQNQDGLSQVVIRGVAVQEANLSRQEAQEQAEAVLEKADDAAPTPETTE